jgi:hypothetical protein
MSVYDYLTCKDPLPGGVPNGLTFKTHDMPCPYHDHYEIREDGSLWYEDYDVEDRSDPNAKGFERYIGFMTRVNKRWIPCAFTGEISFYTETLAFSSFFVKGKLKEIAAIPRDYI